VGNECGVKACHALLLLSLKNGKHKKLAVNASSQFCFAEIFILYLELTLLWIVGLRRSSGYLIDPILLADKDLNSSDFNGVEPGILQQGVQDKEVRRFAPVFL
jgi:hypothetical protein